MKFQLFAVLLVVAGSFASSANEVVEPQNARNFVEIRIRKFIEGFSNMVEMLGLDPFELEERNIKVDLEIFDFLLEAFVEDVRFNGLSNIKINVLEYSHLFNRLRLDVVLPEVRLSVGNSGFEVSVHGIEVESKFRGSLSIKSIRIAGVGHVDVSLGGGISLRSVSLNCSIGRIKSDLHVVALENDFSEAINDLLNYRIPYFLEDNKDDINRIFEDILSAILNRIWN